MYTFEDIKFGLTMTAITICSFTGLALMLGVPFFAAMKAGML